MIDIVPATAPLTPPDTGASMSDMPRSASVLAELARADRRGGAHVDDQRAFREAFGEAVVAGLLPERDAAHDVAVGQHRDDDVGSSSRAPRAMTRRPRRAAAVTLFTFAGSVS